MHIVLFVYCFVNYETKYLITSQYLMWDKQHLTSWLLRSLSIHKQSFSFIEKWQPVYKSNPKYILIELFLTTQLWLIILLSNIFSNLSAGLHSVISVSTFSWPPKYSFISSVVMWIILSGLLATVALLSVFLVLRLLCNLVCKIFKRRLSSGLLSLSLSYCENISIVPGTPVR